jgi:hypothetical protein
MSNLFNQPAFISHAVDEYAKQIQAAMAEFETHMQRGAELALKLGKLCIQAKEAVGHGQWGNFVRLHLGKSERQVRRWMQLANRPFTSDLDEQWRIISGNYDGDADSDQSSNETDSEPASSLTSHDGSADTSTEAEWKPCREHSYSNTRHSECIRCQDLNAENAPKSTAKPKDSTKPKQEENRSPEPPPWTAAVEKAKKHTAPLPELADEICRMLDLPKPRKAALRQSVSVTAEILGEAAECQPVPIRPGNQGKCKKCAATVTWAMTERRKWIALEPARKPPKHGWDIIDGMACPVDGGPFVSHWLRCLPGSNEPIPD